MATLYPSPDCTDKICVEVDPESHDVFAGLGESGSEVHEELGENDGREHYENVGESKLRQPSRPLLGKRYEGASVSREALNGAVDESELDEEDEDPEHSDNAGEDEELDAIDGEMDEDSEIDSDEAFGSGDEEQFKTYAFRGSRQQNGPGTPNNGLGVHGDKLGDDLEDLDAEDRPVEYDSDEDEEEDLDMEDEDVEEDEDEDEDMNDQTDATSEASDDAPTKPAQSSDRAALRALMSADTKAIASSISAAADADAQKGRAVKEQYQTFDKLIDLRIKLQKGLTAANSLPEQPPQEDTPNEAVQRTEEAALQLWSTLESLRHDFLDTQDAATTTKPPSPKKRKRHSSPTPSTPLSTLWSRTKSLESSAVPHRRSTLNKWSTRIRASTAAPDPRSRLLNNSTASSANNITSVIDAYLSTTQPPSSPSSYDDTAFYQSLLRDLISSRPSSTTSTNLSSATLLPTRLPKQHRPNLDTKASKGRKIRYTVHEKMMNFMPAENVGTGRWGEEQIEEFFGSLFGGRRVLDEAEDEAGEEDEEGLRLFK